MYGKKQGNKYFKERTFMKAF